jgi:hypothetical protein
MQLFCFGLCGSVGLVGVNVAFYEQTELKIFSVHISHFKPHKNRSHVGGV